MMAPRNLTFLAIFSILIISSSCYRLRGQSKLSKALLKARGYQGDCIFNYPQNTDGDCEDSDSNSSQNSGQSVVIPGPELPLTPSLPYYPETENPGNGDYPIIEEPVEAPIALPGFGALAPVPVACFVIKENCRTVRGREVCDSREVCTDQ